MENLLNTIKRNKNAILIGSGITTTVVGVMMMKKASVKATAIIQEHKETLEAIEYCIESHSDEYTEEDAKNDAVISSSNTVVKLVKNYAMPVSTTIVGGVITVNGIVKYVRKLE